MLITWKCTSNIKIKTIDHKMIFTTISSNTFNGILLFYNFKTQFMKLILQEQISTNNDPVVLIPLCIFKIFHQVHWLNSQNRNNSTSRFALRVRTSSLVNVYGSDGKNKAADMHKENDVKLLNTWKEVSGQAGLKIP